VSDPRQQGKVRLATAAPGAFERPVQKPIAAASFVLPAQGSRVAPVPELFLPFAPGFVFDELEAVLNTTGFEGFADIPSTPLIAGSPDVSPTPATSPGEPVQFNIKPVLEVKPPAKPIAVYETIEFLDYDDEEDEIPVVEEIPEPAPEPPVLSTPMPVEWPKGAAPGTAKLQQGFGPVVLPEATIEIPQLSLPTMRPRIVRGPNPFAPKPAPVAETRPVAEVRAVAEARPAAVASAPAKVTPPPAVSKPSQPTVRPAAPPPPTVVQRPAAAAVVAAAAVTATPVVTAKAEPVSRPEPVRVNAPQTEKDRRGVVKTAAPPPPPAPQTVARASRERGTAVSVEEPIEPPPAAPKSKAAPIRTPEPLSTPVTHDTLSLGLEADRKTPAAKIVMIAVVATVLAGGAFLTMSGGKSSGSGAGAEGTIADADNLGMVVGGGGWTTTWGADAPNNKGKQISIYRPSMPMTDYRFEFRGQIERKALGWLFRAKDPKNYYVMKLEMIKPGPNPVVAMVKYAVINGKETTHTQVMLPFDVNLATTYQVRLDVKGDKFTTSVQGKLLDYWTDDRIKVGGAGFYTESGERSQVKSSQVSYLR
jgi:hypothetical protein